MEDVFDRLTDVLAEKTVSKMAASQVWINQKDSPLGPRRHCAAVRRRVGEGKEDATILGKRFLLTQEALNEEMVRACIVPPVKVREPELTDIEARIEARLRRRSA